MSAPDQCIPLLVLPLKVDCSVRGLPFEQKMRCECKRSSIDEGTLFRSTAKKRDPNCRKQTLAGSWPVAGWLGSARVGPTGARKIQSLVEAQRALQSPSSGQLESV